MTRRIRRSASCLTLALALPLVACSGGGEDGDDAAEPVGDPTFLATFGGQPGVDGIVQAIARFQGDIYVGGSSIESAGGVAAAGIARFDGERWSPVGSGLDFSCRAFALFDDGSGPALYVGGSFDTVGGIDTQGIARWDGTTWSDVGGGVASGSVTALAVYDDGAGAALYAAGGFSKIGGVSADGIARWDGSVWSALGAGTDPLILCLQVFDDGGGDALYAGGFFSSAGGLPAASMARWDGDEWSALASDLGKDSGVVSVQGLAVFDAGAGPALYAVGDFTTAGGAAAEGIARWDGASWSAVGGSVQGNASAITAIDEAQGPALYVSGSFTTAGGVAANRIARWNGVSWSALTSGVNGNLQSLEALDDGTGPKLYVGGNFSTAGGLGVGAIARWDGTAWSTLGSGLSARVDALATFDDGAGSELYAGGLFPSIGNTVVNRIARWDGQSWSTLASGVNSVVYAMAVHDDGSGPALYVGGEFTLAGGAPASRIARWRNGTWSAVGTGFDASAQTLAVFDDGTGPALYAGGSLSMAGAVLTLRIARWDGVAWSAVADGLSNNPECMAVFDDGTGDALYVGGYFDEASGVPVNRIARWDGTAWSALGSGLEGGSFPSAEALAVFDDGTGDALYVGGSFTTAGGQTVNGIARWDGSAWSGVGGGINLPNTIRSLVVHDDGSGSALYAGGGFVTAGGVTVNRVARWDGTSWTPLETGVSGGLVHAMARFEHGGQTALAIGGNFDISPAGDSYLALWGAPSATAALSAGVDAPVAGWTGFAPAMHAEPCALEAALFGAHHLDDVERRLVLEDARVAPSLPFEWTAGTIELRGGSWTQDTPLVLGRHGPARLVLSDGARLRVPSVIVGPEGELAGEGVVSGDLWNEGRVVPAGLGIRVRGRHEGSAAVTDAR